MLVRFALIALAWITAGTLHAQNPPAIEFERITHPADDGLQLSFILSVVQDSAGYLWVGTLGRLYRYDGYNFKGYIEDSDDPSFVAPYHVDCLFVDHQGTLWIGTGSGNGLFRYEPRTDSFTRYLHDPNNPNSLGENNTYVIYEAPSEPGILWIGTQEGLDRFDIETQTFTHYRHDPDDPTSLSFRSVRAIYEDGEGVLWVGMGQLAFDTGGLNRFDRTTGKFKRFVHDPEDENSLVSSSVHTIFEDSQGTLCVGTRGDGLIVTTDRQKTSHVICMTREICTTPLDPLL